MTTATSVTTTSLQDRLDTYWSGRAVEYHAHQVSGARAAIDRELWTSVFTTSLEGCGVDKAGALDILDVGTGSGYLASLLTDAGHHVTGVDHSPGMVAAAHAAHPELFVLNGDAHSPGLPASSLDAVVNRYVLWTLPDPVAAAKAWRTLLRPGGTVVAVDATWFPHGVDPAMKVPSADGEDAFARTYDPATLGELPLGTAASMDDFAEVFRVAGFTDVTVQSLPQVAELDRRFGVAPGHESRPHFVVTAS
jgi:SAM-dependent methyltransferase